MAEDGSDRRGPFDDLKEDSLGDSESIRVAVRVRPFNAREAARGCKCCVEMSGTMLSKFTSILLQALC